MVRILKIKSVEPFILYAQDTTKGYSKEPNVGGYTGYQVVVRIGTDEGLEGWGECCTGSEFGEAAYAVRVLIEKGLKPRLLGKDPTEYRKIWEALYSAMEWYGRRGIAIFALSGIDTALVDVTGKKLGVPAHRLLGDAHRTEIRLYASLLFDMDDPEGTAKKGVSYVRKGYAGVKYGWGMLPSKPFGLHPDKDLAIVATIRDRIGPDPWLMVDVGRYVNWSVPHAVQMARRLEKYKPYWLEEALPQDDIEGFIELSRSVDTTIAGGEGYQTLFDFKELITRKALDLVQPDPSKAGGLSEARRIVEYAYANNTMWVPHNWSTAINTAASLQLVASSPDAFLMEFKEEPNPLVNNLTKRKFEVKDGKMQVPGGPGLGIEVDMNAVERYSVR
jgi:D-galactarolactone cycloisomerase